MELSNYPALCKALDIKPKTSNSKKAQIKEIERYIKLNRKGHRFIVKEVYDTPKPAMGGSGNIYNGLIQLLITDMIVEAKGETILISRSKLLRELKMVNHNYAYCNGNRSKFAKYIDMNIGFIHDFMNTTNSNYRSIIRTALDDLVDRSVITYKWVHSVCTKKNVYRKATKQEEELIIDSQKQLLIEMEYKKISEVMFTSDWPEFKKTLNFMLQKKSDISFPYMSYEIVAGSYLNAEQDGMIISYLEDAERRGYKKELNNLLLVRLLDNALKRQDDALKGNSTSTNKKLLKFRKDLALSGNTKKLMRYLIDGTTRIDIEDQIKQQDERRREEALKGAYVLNVFSQSEQNKDVQLQ